MTIIVPGGTSDAPNEPNSFDYLQEIQTLKNRAPGYYLFPDDWPWNVRGHDLTVDQVYGVLRRFTEPAQLNTEELGDVPEKDSNRPKYSDEADG